MKAWVINSVSNLDTDSQPLELIEMERPIPQGREVLIKISCCGICHTELDEIEGRTAPPVYPVIPGHQVVGTVEECAIQATRFTVGERIGVAWIFSACGICECCVSGMENLCAEFRGTGRDKHGGYAEYMVVDERFAYRIPSLFSDTDAAPLLCAGAIGYRSLKLSGLSDGHTLGLTGFGASGHIMLKVARYLYPRSSILVFARDLEEQRFALSLGASWVGDITQSPPFKANAIIDTTPVWSTATGSLLHLKPGGRLVINAIRKESLDQDALLQLRYHASKKFFVHALLIMPHNAFQHNIPMLRSLFKGREDVFAVRWEKGNRSGYMPAYQYDPHHYRMHKINGGTFQNYNHKNYLPLTEKEIKKHLAGGQQIGIYPLLADNTSWFLVADFDKQNWKDEAVTFLTACNKKGIPAYLERSRSGNGAHVWIFFQKPYPAVKSRNIFTSILQQCGLTSIFDKNSSFDRLFPNQDFHAGKGLGNLIALPFFGPAVESGNSCFINPESFVSFPDQWAFLHKIEKVSTDVLDSLHLETSKRSGAPIPLSNNCKALISLHQNIRIGRDSLITPLIDFLKEELNFANTEFFVKKKAGKSTFGTEKYFKLLEEAENEVVLPRGFIGRLLRFCKEKNIDYEFEDERQKREPVHFSFNATLRSHQEQAISSVVKKDFGIIVAPPGSGKTVMGLKIIADKQQPALIIVHRKQLLEQWSERIQSFLGIPKNEVGIIGQGKAKIGRKITIGTIQSLPKQINNIQNRFGVILVDECHHIPAKTFRTTIEKLKSYYLYGLTATPFRKYSDDKMVLAYLGDIIADIPTTQVEHYKHAQIVVRNTSLDVPFNSKTDKFETLSQILIHDSARNKLIVDDIKKELSKGIRIAIITERKEHIDTLYLFLKQVCEVITLSGDDTDNIRKRKWQALNDGNFQALITTGQYFGEGSDLSNISALFLVYPFSFKGKLIQYLGRVQRSETNPTIYDYRDLKIDYLNKLFLKRNTYYRQISKQRSLFDEPTDFTPPKQNTIIAKQIKVSIGDLDFRYGNVGFEYIDKERNERLEFEIENEEIRPEFEVLKPYFIKILGSNHVVIDIHAELENGVILSQLATSQDIVNINKEIIESVKFQFLSKSFIGQIPKAGRNILTADELPVDQKVYENAEQILTDLLRSKSYKHARHILFLANKHERTIMKLRFVLQPFSFVFLLKGDQNYHIILETLDTEEATYIWHTDNNRKSLLIETVKKIDQELSIIRKKGRQAYLETDPQNFSKIVHDYTDNEKGFITWISQLEERLT